MTYIEKFKTLVKTPEDVPIEAVKWMRQRNNLGLEIFQEQLSFNECVSNSHCSPVDGVQNWSRADDIPKGYPGWTAHWVIGISVKDYNNLAFLSDLFNVKWGLTTGKDGRDLYHLEGIYFGSGGSCDKPINGKKEMYLHYYIKFFRDDFPGLRVYYAKDLLTQ